MDSLPDRAEIISDPQARAVAVRSLKERVADNTYTVSADLVAEAILIFHLGPESLNDHGPEPPAKPWT